MVSIGDKTGMVCDAVITLLHKALYCHHMEPLSYVNLIKSTGGNIELVLSELHTIPILSPMLFIPSL